MTDLEPLLLTVEQTAKRLSFTPRQVRDLIRDGCIPVATGTRARTRINWPPLQRHLDSGGALSPRWWVTHE